MKFFSLLGSKNILYLISFLILTQPIKIIASFDFKEYVALDNAKDYSRPIYVNQLLQKYSKGSVCDKNATLWVNLYEPSEKDKMLGSTLALSLPINHWSNIYGTLGGLIAQSSWIKPIQISEIFSELNIVMGDLRKLPFYCRIGLFDIPFGLNASHLLPSELMYTQQISRSLRKQMGCNVIVASSPITQQTVINFCIVMDQPFSGTKKHHSTLSGGTSIYCPVLIHPWLQCNLGGGIHIHSANYQLQWNIYADAILSFWRVYAEITQMQHERFAVHVESSMRVSVLQHPLTFVGLFEQGQFESNDIHNNILVGCKVNPSKYFNVIGGIKIDLNQLIHKASGQLDASSRLSSFVCRAEFHYC